MTYLSDRKRTRTRSFRLFAVVVLLAALTFGWRGIKSTLEPAVIPSFVASHSVLNRIVSVPYSLINYMRSRDKEVLQITNLEMRTEELENQIADLQTKLADAGGSGEATSTRTSKTKGPIVMYPLAQDITSIYSTLLLSKGFKDGVSDNALVYVRGRQPVCTVIELHPTTSLCKLLSASGNEVDGVIQGVGETIPLTGLGGGNFIALVPKESTYTVGESVMYRADQTMKLGDIVDIKNDPQDTFAKVYVRGTYNPVTSSLFYADKE